MPLAKPRANGTQYVQKEAYMSGTSMAAPQVTAVIAAGRQSYLKLNDAKRSGRGLIQFNRLKGST
jgi:subtilisin family serine protease